MYLRAASVILVGLVAVGCGGDATTDPVDTTTSSAPDTTTSAVVVTHPDPTTSTEVTDLPDGYQLSARTLFPAEVREIETAAAALFGPRLAFHAGTSDTPETDVRIFVVRADATDIAAGQALATANVGVLISPALASTDDLREVAVTISVALTELRPDIEASLSIEPLDQTITVGTPPGTADDVIEQLAATASTVIDAESARIAAERPDSVDIDIAWSTRILRFATVLWGPDDAPIG